MTTKAEPNVHSAICAIMGEIKTIEKSQKHANQGWSFAGRDDIVKAVRPLMVKHGVTFALSWLDDDQYEAVYTSAADPESTLSFVIRGIGSPKGSKQEGTPQGYGSAIAYIEKYAHRTTFAIDTGEMVDEAAGGDPDHGTPKKAAAPLQAQQSPEVKQGARCKAMRKTLGIDELEAKEIYEACGNDLDVFEDTLNGMIKGKAEADKLLGGKK